MSPRTYLIAILAVLLAAVHPPPARADDHSLAMKAAMIYNFTRFSTWPGTRFSSPSSPVVLCVDPANALGAELIKLEGRPVGARRLHVRRGALDGGCHAAVLSVRETSPGTISGLNRQGVLTIGETAGFSRTGAIGLMTVGRQVRFEINVKVAQAAGISLSSKLLRLAIAVR